MSDKPSLPKGFLRARTKYAGGANDWQYFDWDPKKWGSTMEEAQEVWTRRFRERYADPGLSQYRGCDVEVIAQPPKEWLEKAILDAQEARKTAKQRIRWFSRVLGQEAPRSLWSTVSQDKLEELALVGLALVGMGHELNYLTSQFWYSANRLQAMLRRVPTALSELGRIRTSFKHIEHMIRQTQAVLPPSLRKAPQVITGEAIYNYVAGFKAHPLSACSVTLTATPEFRAFEFTGQSHRILPVFLSLVENALLWVGKQNRGKPYKESDNRILFDIRDNGVIVADTGTGITPDMQHVLFEPFRSSRVDGRGMGLYLARLVLERDGYDINVKDNGPLCGACFLITPKEKSEEK